MTGIQECKYGALRVVIETRGLGNNARYTREDQTLTTKYQWPYIHPQFVSLGVIVSRVL